MPILEPDVMDELFLMTKESFLSNANVQCKVVYETGVKSHDKVNNRSIYANKTVHEYTLKASYKEEKRNSNVISSGIIEGVPTGVYNIYLNYDDKVLIDAIPNYIENSLKFVLRPNSISPTILYPNMGLTKIEYFLDDEDYPFLQRFICNVKVT